jgi:hypothetical protein
MQHLTKLSHKHTRVSPNQFAARQEDGDKEEEVKEEKQKVSVTLVDRNPGDVKKVDESNEAVDLLAPVAAFRREAMHESARSTESIPSVSDESGIDPSRDSDRVVTSEVSGEEPAARQPPLSQQQEEEVGVEQNEGGEQRGARKETEQWRAAAAAASAGAPSSLPLAFPLFFSGLLCRPFYFTLSALVTALPLDNPARENPEDLDLILKSCKLPPPQISRNVFLENPSPPSEAASRVDESYFLDHFCLSALPGLGVLQKLGELAAQEKARG